MKTQKCCAHCPGKFVSPGSNEYHECCQPRYVSGNLKISSLKKHVADCCRKKEDREELPALSLENRPNCYDQFAIAKKLHAENLEHQPLPDRVDDSVFKLAKPNGSCCESLCGKCNCCKREIAGHCTSLESHGPALGCKEPKTKMDLAICWETPIDPAYEPRRPAHIDGSDGGLAPAIFTLVQHASSSKVSVHSGASRSAEASSSCRGRCKSQESIYHPGNENKEENNESKNSCCDCLCKDLNRTKISEKDEARERLKRVSFRKCIACDSRNTGEDPRLIKSAVGLALGMEKAENNQRRGESKTTIPRPKTSFVRKSSSTDTLTSPLNVISRCKNVDFPEHWRFMSVYQQSYRNPHRRRIYRC
ncbi:unnamed protein product [Xylocopa violacea]|uniref:DUF4812 domain-containing protein n=1 Tax=Xylocopa violacea TaxID=135666 RepID=A0ABP1NV03_XYLVO